jgi:Na+-transporting NADH:ubiquinone oxidoreductase subunit C
MMKRKIYPVVYMFVITAFFSSMLIGFAKYTRPRVEINKSTAKEAAVLQVLGLYESASGSEIHRIFQQRVRSDPAAAGSYVVESDGQIQTYAVEIQGKGFWAPIKGFIGVAADRQQIVGLAFYEQAETPGLGARITEPEFRSQFARESNLRIAAGSTPFEIIPPGTPRGDNQCHAISGATQTSVRLEKIINESINRWRGGLAQKEGGR